MFFALCCSHCVWKLLVKSGLYISYNPLGSVWPIADNIPIDCKVNGGLPRPLLTY